MAGLGTLLAIASIGRQAVGIPLRRMVHGIVAAAMLGIVTAVLAAMLIGMGLYGAYLALLAQGLSQVAALLTVSGVVALLAAVCGLCTMRAVDRISTRMPSFMPHSPLPFDISDTVDAFLSGLFAEPAARNVAPVPEGRTDA